MPNYMGKYILDWYSLVAELGWAEYRMLVKRLLHRIAGFHREFSHGAQTYCIPQHHARGHISPILPKNT